MNRIVELIFKNKYLLLAIAISFISVFSLLNNGLPPTHDGEYHVIRFYEFDKTLRSGSFFPRWAQDLNLGYGVPLFNYAYPLPNYVSFFFHFLGFSFIDSFKLNMISASIIGSAFFYFWTRRYWGDLGGLVSSVFYSFTPYRLLDIYIRGSVGELWALSLMPVFLWSIDRYLEKPNPSNFVLATVFLSLIIFSHNILALIIVTFSIFYVAIKLNFVKKRKDSAIDAVKVFVLGIGISSIFWFPALFEKEFVRGLDIFDYSKNFVDLSQLLIPSWGSGFSGTNANNQMSFQLGIANIAVIAISIFSLPFLIKKNKKTAILTFFFLISFFIVAFFMFEKSLPLWKSFPFLSYFQFPWRFLSIELIITSFLAGGLIYFLSLSGKERLSKISTVILIILSVGLSWKYSKPAYFHQREDKHYISKSNFIDGTNSPGNSFNTIWFNSKIGKSKSRLMSDFSELTITTNKPTKIKAIADSLEKAKITANIAYFFTWTVYINKKNVPTKITKDGIFEFEVPRGKSTIEIELKDTPIRIISYILTIGSIGLLFGLFVRDKYIKIR